MNSYLTPCLMSVDGIVGATELSVAGTEINIKPFDRENERISFIEWPVAILHRQKVDEFLLDDLDMIVADGIDRKKIKRLDELFRSSNLYSFHADDPVVGVVLSPEGCWIL